MSTVKISQLPDIPGGLNANTSNSLFLGVDIPTGVTGKFTATQLAERLYANNILNVGDNTLLLPNVIAQFSGDSNNYIQINLENDSSDGSSDYVATADVGTDTTHYVDFGINNSDYADRPLDGYVLAAGDTSNTIGGNLIVGSITQGKSIDFVLGGVEDANIVGQFIYNTGFKLNKNPLIFADGTTQNTAAKDAQFTQDAFDTANNNSTNITIIQGVNVTQNNNIISLNTYAISAFAKANAANNLAISSYIQANAANVLAVGAFAKANAALANTSGTFAGNLYFTGNIVARSIATSNLVSFVSDTTPAGNAVVEIIGSAGGIQQAPSNDGYMIHVTGKANTPTRIVSDSFGTNAYAIFAGRTGRGTAETPTAVANNDVVMRIAGNGWGTTGFAPLGTSRIDFVASENYTDTARGSRIEFFNTVNGANTLNKIASFNATDVTFTGTVNPTKGFIFTPRIPAGNQTAITIDYSNDSTIKANLIADLVISHSNYTYGKIVEVWLTNNDNANHTVTHGCAALRSTNKSTTFTITSQSSAYMRFFSIDGDNANTFVTINA